MPTRVHTDSDGVRWDIRSVVQQSAIGPHQPPITAQFRPPTTYLLFESDREIRRLAPTPVGWLEFPTEELQALLRKSTVIAIRPAKS